MLKFILFLTACALHGCTSMSVAVVTSWAGSYEVIDKAVVPSSSSPTGVMLATEASGKGTPVTNYIDGNRINPKVGYGFGVIYEVPSGLRDNLKAIVYMPAPGVPDQRNGKFVLQSEWVPNCSEGKCRAMYNFEHESELVPGVWRIDLWRKGERLLTNTFTLEK